MEELKEDRESQFSRTVEKLQDLSAKLEDSNLDLQTLDFSIRDLLSYVQLYPNAKQVAHLVVQIFQVLSVRKLSFNNFHEILAELISPSTPYRVGKVLFKIACVVLLSCKDNVALFDPLFATTCSLILGQINDIKSHVQFSKMVVQMFRGVFESLGLDFVKRLLSKNDTNILEKFQFLLSYVSKTDENLWNAYLQHLSPVFLKKVSVASPDLFAWNWSFYYKYMKNEEWNGSVLPTVIKALKKSPETLASLSSHILSELAPNVSLDALVEDGIVSIGLKLLKSEDPGIKYNGSLIILALCRKASSACLAVLLHQLVNALSGKFPGVSVISIPHENHKTAIYSTLFFCVSEVVGNHILLSLDDIVDPLFGLMEKESDANYRFTAAAIISLVFLKLYKFETDNGAYFLRKMSELQVRSEKAATSIVSVKALALFIFSRCVTHGSFSLLILQNFAGFIDSCLKDSAKKTGGINYEGLFSCSLSLVLLEVGEGSKATSKNRAALISFIRIFFSENLRDLLVKHFYPLLVEDVSQPTRILLSSRLQPGLVILLHSLVTSVSQITTLLTAGEFQEIYSPFPTTERSQMATLLVNFKPNEAMQILSLAVFYQFILKNYPLNIPILMKEFAIPYLLFALIKVYGDIHSKFPKFTNFEEHAELQRCCCKFLSGLKVNALDLLLSSHVEASSVEIRILVVVAMALLFGCNSSLNLSKNNMRSLISAFPDLLTGLNIFDVAQALFQWNYHPNEILRPITRNAIICLPLILKEERSAKEFILFFGDLLNTKISLFSLTDEEIQAHLHPEEALEKRIQYLASITSENPPVSAVSKKRETGSSAKGKFADKKDIDWADRVKKEKGGIKEDVLPIEELAKQDVEAQAVKVRNALSEAISTLDLLKTFQYFEHPLVDLIVLRLLQTGFMYKCLASPLLATRIFDALMPLVKKVLDLPGHTSIALEVVGSLMLIESSNPDLSGEELSHNLLFVLEKLKPTVLSAETKFSHSFTFLFFLHISKKLCTFGTRSHAEKAFELIQRLWPSFTDELVIEAELSATLRSSVVEILRVGLTLVERFPSCVILVDRFLIGLMLECAPPSRDELELVCSETGLLHKSREVRTLCTELLYAFSNILEYDVISTSTEYDAVIWICQYTDTPKVNELTTDLWRNKKIGKDSVEFILQNLLPNSSAHIRKFAVSGLVNSLVLYVDEAQFVGDTVKFLYDTYSSCIPAAEFEDSAASDSKFAKSKMDIKIKPKMRKPAEESDEKWFLRENIALFSLLCADQDSLNPWMESILRFSLEFGSTDMKPEIRNIFLDAGKKIVENFGQFHMSLFLSFFEEVLARKPSSSEKLADFDHRYAATVVLLGTLAQHMDQNSATLQRVMNLLLESLLIPSESVQRAVSNCLGPLARLLKSSSQIDTYINCLLTRLLEGNSYGDRRGAAFGVGAIVKGLGLSSLKQYSIISKLKEACLKGSISARQGALFGYECLAEHLGILFEPYLATIVDSLLASYSNSSDHVREAAGLATKAIMSHLSPYGVKQLLHPIILIITKETSWKSRQEAIKMLGIIVNCAPKQVSPSLPQIVSHLVDKSASDPHPKVKESAKLALQDISSVIKNPEVSRLSNILLLALADPANRTRDALESLLACEFIHSIDSPSLALLFPILARALKDRGGDVKRKAAAITGNIISMIIEPGCLIPYIPAVIPGLKDCLIDPIPDVRASGAKALGNLYNGIDNPDTALKEMLTWLLETLKSENSPVERSGAAQGLAEICGSTMDSQRRDSIITWVQGQKAEKSSAREGMMWFFSFLPSTMKEQFSLYLESCLPVILSGFNDETESVREVSLRAGKAVISVLGLKYCVELASLLILGVFNDDWKVRLNSLQLLGDLLFLIGEVKVGWSDVDGEEDAEEGEQLGSSKIVGRIKERLGKDLTEQVLSAIYIVRNDIAVAVRQNALLIWKSVISSTPRTLVEIMPTLIHCLVAKLSCEDEDLRIISGRAIGELVSKLGDKVLPIIIKPFENGLNDTSEMSRLGICMGLTEVLAACSRKQTEEYIRTITSVVQAAVSDESLAVTQQAAKAFMILYRTTGPIAVDEIVPVILKALSNLSMEELSTVDDSSSRQLRGLKEIVSIKPREMLEYLLPTLLVPPLQIVNLVALSTVVEVAGNFLHSHFASLFSVVLQEICAVEAKLEGGSLSPEKSILENARLGSMKRFLISVLKYTGNSGIHQLILEIGKQIEHDTLPRRRKWGCFMAQHFFIENKADYDEYLPLLLKFLLSRITDTDSNILTSVKDAIASFAASVPYEKILPHIDFFKNCIMSNVSSARHRTATGFGLVSESGEIILPLLTVPKSLDAFYAIFQFGLINGSSQAREISADMIGQLAKLAHPDVLKPTIIKTIGPLIRVVGERHPSNVKAAILSTIIIFLDRVPSGLKAFAPQLQTTFIKSLSDPLKEVRTKSGLALGKLISSNGLKVDIILSDLVNLTISNESIAIKLSLFGGINNVLYKSGDKTSQATFEKLKALTISHLSSEEETIRLAAAKTVSFVALYGSEALISDMILDIFALSKLGPDESIPASSGKLLGLAAVVASSGKKCDEFREEAFEFFLGAAKENFLLLPLSKAMEILLTSPSVISSPESRSEFKQLEQNAAHKFLPTICSIVQNSQANSEIRINCINAIKEAAKFVYGATSQHMSLIFPLLISLLKDIDLRVKYSVETCMKILCEGPTANHATSNQFQQYLSRAEPDVRKFLTDYHSRILLHLTISSEEEESVTW